MTQKQNITLIQDALLITKTRTIHLEKTQSKYEYLDGVVCEDPETKRALIIHVPTLRAPQDDQGRYYWNINLDDAARYSRILIKWQRTKSMFESGIMIDDLTFLIIPDANSLPIKFLLWVGRYIAL